MQLNFGIKLKTVILLAGLFLAISLFFALNVGDQAGASVPCGSYTPATPASPIVDGFSPCGTTINTTTANIGANFTDSAGSWPPGNYGIILSYVTVKLDGALLSGCTVSGSDPYTLAYPAGTITYRTGSVSCPVSGLTDGVHNYEVFARGPMNWSSTGYASFTVDTSSTCTPAKPSLSLSAPAPFWASYADYIAGQLSVDWTISNTGTNGATNVAITGSSNNNGVAIVTTLPASVGSISAGGSAVVTLKYNVGSVGGWRTSTTASADDDCSGTGYTYP